MNLNDRVALILGRAIIRAEENAVLLEQQSVEIAEIRAALDKLTETPDGEEKPV